MSYAWVERQGDTFSVVVLGKFVKDYSSPDNARVHAEQIQRAISNPLGLNQRPGKKNQ